MKMENDINAILAAYMDAAEAPGGAPLKEWIRRYPQHEAELTRFAVYRHTTTQADARFSVATEDAAWEAGFLRRAGAIRTRMQVAQRAAAPPLPAATLKSLLEAAKARGLNAAALATALELSPVEVIKLNQRLFRAASIPKALAARLAELLDVTAQEITAYLRLGPTVSAQASYRADSAPRVMQTEDFAEAISRSSNLTPAQKARWMKEAEETMEER